MQTINEPEVTCREIERIDTGPPANWARKLKESKTLVVLVTVALAFVFRVYKLDATGLAEDEANKVFAVRAYDQGDFSVNAEHPMIMKMLCYLSVHTCERWNHTGGASLKLVISEETALRLPNAIFGSLSVIPLFLLATSLLGSRGGLLTALMWALGLDAIWFNRIVKEDTLFVFFMLSAFCLYDRAKHQAESEIKRQEVLYFLAGAAFGMMVASKYIPHFVGLNALFYTLVGYDRRNNRPLTRRMWGCYFGAMLVAFAAFDWALFVPQTWRYLSKYVSEELVTHHGYLVMDKLFVNDLGHTPDGNPWYFYGLFLLVKLPLPLLVVFAIGLVKIFRQRSDELHPRGYLFLRMMLIFWLLPMSVLGAKFLRYTLSLMPFVYMTAAVGIVAAWRFARSKALRAGASYRMAGRLAATAAITLFVVSPTLITVSSMPYPSLYVNAIGGARRGYFFPHDEYYDLGARESIAYLAATAPPRSTMASEIPGVVDYYLERWNRRDIRSEIMSQPGFSVTRSVPDYVLLQRGRVYIENRESFAFVEKNFDLTHCSIYGSAVAARVFRTRDQSDSDLTEVTGVRQKRSTGSDIQ
jgi:dolichyl-phosphate-mannose-protein mannosyltransferase